MSMSSPTGKLLVNIGNMDRSMRISEDKLKQLFKNGIPIAMQMTDGLLRLYKETSGEYRVEYWKCHDETVKEYAL